MLEQLNSWDTSFFWWINSHHNVILDWTLWCSSQGWSWAIVLIVSVIGIGKKHHWNNIWILLIGVVVCFLLSDRISVMCFKDVVMRLRPCHALEGVRMFHTTCGGKYGFISSHAANCCSVAVLLSLAGKNYIKHLPVLLTLWALLVCYSRPYLGKHYPGDVICGAIVGVGIGALVYFLYAKSCSWIDRRRADSVSSSVRQ